MMNLAEKKRSKDFNYKLNQLYVMPIVLFMLSAGITNKDIPFETHMTWHDLISCTKDSFK